ncbi:MAG: radical SAM family heme chaperone HemW [Gammaproteobacteria bacterium]|nr:radical SAM family heme chaperone HemW [Gammaproteobacteria bacterium]
MFNFTATPPLSLYIHIPWCVRKCPYCDFNSHEARDEIPEAAYIDALIADLEQDLPAVWGRTVETVFFGGGTPSLFSPEGIDRLLADVRARIALKPQAEITLEANPGTVDHARFKGFREAGINRLSIGIQSFQPELLKKIGRIHSDTEAITAVEAAHQAGFENFNLDLMFGLPGQTQKQALQDLQMARDLKPAHISWYELTIEPNTWFHRHPPQRPDDNTLWEMQQAGRALLEAAGYQRYEVSAYGRAQQQCRHNMNYWQFGDYLGIGAGAHAKISDAATQGITRTAKQRHPRNYLENAHTSARIGSSTRIKPADAVLEFAMNALRLDQGFSPAAFTVATGLSYTGIESIVNKGVTDGLLSDDAGVIRTTPKGQRFLNELLQHWMPDTTDHD